MSAIVSVAAPLRPLEALWPLTAGQPVFLWAPREQRGDGEIAWGVARAIHAGGSDRFAQLAAAAPSLFLDLVEDRDAPRARAYGGLAFHAGAARDWPGFVDGTFFLPRWRYTRRGDRAWLSVLCDDEPSSTVIDACLAALAVLPPTHASAAAAAHDETPLGVIELVEAACRAIAAGEIEKVVVSRGARLHLSTDLDPAAALSRLDDPACTRFAYRPASAVFLGATPEHLLERCGDQVTSDGLAGTGPVGAPAWIGPKERREQSIVVDEIAAALAPSCSALEITPATLLRLRHVEHLYSRVHGRLRQPRHLLELAGALHPTPATGGRPRQAALDWVAAHERERRGWYAAPLGWFDRHGDGVLAVALRCALVDGVSARLFAGAGIVAGSRPQAEVTEMQWKQRALAAALGATT